jgi:sigma-54 specific flagellar transcriptional regulator A
VAASPEVIGVTIMPAGATGHGTLPAEGFDLKEYLARIEREMIETALADSNGVVQHAAELLGVGRTTLVEKIRRHNIKQ